MMNPPTTCQVHRPLTHLAQIYTDMETTAVIYYYVRSKHALVERFELIMM